MTTTESNKASQGQEPITAATRLSARLTTRFTSPTEPLFEGQPRRMTVAQIMEEYNDLRRGGTYVGMEVFHGARKIHPLDVSDLADQFEADREIG